MSSLEMTLLLEIMDHVERCPLYESCIKFDGKSILPPVLTSEKRMKMAYYRKLAVERAANVDEAKNENELLKMDNATELCYSDNDSLGISIPVSTAHSTNSCSQSNDVYSSISEKCHIEDAVHMDASKKILLSPDTGENCNLSWASSEINLHVGDSQSYISENVLQNNSTSVNDSESILIANTIEVPSITIMDDTYVVGEDVPMVNEESDYESMPTVIHLEKCISDDVDNESNTTCVTQSTDLEKYFDYPIEYSSTDDCNDNESGRLCISSCSPVSENASCETIVNTESGKASCASATAEFGVILNVCSEKQSTHFAPKRVFSADSYLNTLKDYPRHHQIEKSQSNTLSPFSLVPTIDSCLSSNTTLKSPVMYQYLDHEQIAKDNVTPIKVGHKRKNSYTLEYPSPELLNAHQNCNCHSNVDGWLTPHSIPLNDRSASANPAFKKEIVFLPLTSIKNSLPLENTNFCNELLPSEQNSVVESQSLVGESSVSRVDDVCCLGADVSIKSDIREVELSECRTNYEMKEKVPNAENIDAKELFTMVLEKLNIEHSNKMNKLLEEHKRQIEELQAELNEKEKLLHEKFLTFTSALKNENKYIESSIVENIGACNEKYVLRNSSKVKDIHCENNEGNGSDLPELQNLLNEEKNSCISCNNFKSEFKKIPSPLCNHELNMESNVFIPKYSNNKDEICSIENIISLQELDTASTNNSDINSVSLHCQKITEQNNSQDKNGNMINSFPDSESNSDSHSKNHVSRNIFPVIKSASSDSFIVASPQKNNCSSYPLLKDAMYKQTIVPPHPFIKPLTNAQIKQKQEMLNDPEFMKKFERLPALVKGYLTRRLINSETVQDYKRKMEDIVIEIEKLDIDLSSKSSISENDKCLYFQLTRELEKRFKAFYETLCIAPVEERMKIIAQSRDSRLKKLKLDQSKSMLTPKRLEKFLHHVPANAISFSQTNKKPLTSKCKTSPYADSIGRKKAKCVRSHSNKPWK